MRVSMTKLWVAGLLIVMGCVPGSSPIRITGFFPIDPGMGGKECKLDAKIGITGGTLDASGGGDFLLVMSVDSEANIDPEISDNRNNELTTPGKHIFIIDALVTSYKSTNPVIQFDTEQTPLSGSIQPNSHDTRIGMDILTDKAADKLRTQLTDTTQKTQLLVTVSLKGHLESGETVVSNPVVFPIEVRTSNLACPEPGNVSSTGLCGSRGGQGGTTFTCCAAGVPSC